MATEKLINANEFLRRLFHEPEDVIECPPRGYCCTGNDPSGYSYETVTRVVQETPAVDAEEVVHGRWIPVPSSDMMTGKAYKCSECKNMRYGSFMPNYCQNCGAKMDGGADNGR